VGDRWVYEQATGRTWVEVTQVVTSVEKHGGALRVRVASKDDSGLTPRSEWLVSTAGIYDLQDNEQSLKLPARPGENWLRTGLPPDAGRVHEALWQFAGEEHFTILAGAFQTLRVDVVRRLGDREVRRSFWYARGIGLVASCEWGPDGTRQFLCVLKAFMPAKE
jgi:hypothetical protein